MCPDLNLHPTLIDAANPTELAWVYQSSPAARPPAIDLDDLPVEVDWSRKRMIWMIYGSCHLATIEDMLTRITECSKVIVLEAQAPDAYHLLPSERERLLEFVEAERLTVIVGGALAQRAEKLLQLIDINLHDGWKPILSQALMNDNPQEIRKLFEQFAGGLNSKILSKGTYLTAGAHYLRNTLINAPLASSEGMLSVWKNSRTDRPVLIVAAGPSLNKQLPLLADNQDLFTILAVNTVWPILEKHGIVPDAVLSLDRNSKPAWPVNAVSPKTAFCVDLGCAPRLLWSHNHNHVITACDPFISALAGHIGAKGEFLRTGGSVATTAFSLAEVLGGNPIVLIGQDLALTGRRDHAEGYPHTYDSQTLTDRYENGFDVDGYHGGRVRTERQLMYYKNWFEGRAKELTGKLIINATEGGACIAGTLQVPFASVCSEIRATSLRKSPLMEPVKRRIDPEHMANLREGLATLRDNLRQFGELASEGRTLCQKIGAKPSKKQMARIDKMNQRIRDQEPHSKLFVDVMCMNQLEAIRYKSHTGEGMTDLADAVKKYDEVYQNIETTAKQSDKMLEELDEFYAQVAQAGDIELSLLDKILPP